MSSRSDVVRSVVTPLLVVLLLLATIVTVGTRSGNALPGSSARAQQLSASAGDPMIVVTGEGRVAVVPDTAQATLGVQMQDADVTTAVTTANQQMNAVVDAVRDMGVDERDIQTVTFSIAVDRDFDQPEQPITGYTVTNLVRVQVSPVEQIGALIDTAVNQGANQVQDVSFTVRDTEALVRQAREQAMTNARERAEHLAALGGVTLGAPVMISETSAPPPTLQPGVPDDMAVAEGAARIEAGEEEVTLTVSVAFALE